MNILGVIPARLLSTRLPRKVLREIAGLPMVVYVFRRAQMCRMLSDLLVATDHSTNCPFKGDASYWTLETERGRYENLVWSYEDPLPELAEIAGLFCFYNELVELQVDEDRS